MSFKDIRGQDTALGILKGYLRSAAVSGAWLFTGPEGVGKSLAAATFAKAVNCLEREDDSCDGCIPCRKIDRAQHPDVHFIEPQDSESIKIESIRRLKEDISLRPYEAEKKAFIINDAHLLTAEASNALLKVLEEPPGASLIILVTSKPALLFRTIVSRCKALRFYALRRDKVQEILSSEHKLDEAAAHFLAYYAEGRLGMALRLKDGDFLSEKNRVIDAFCVRRHGYESGQAPAREELRCQLNILAAWFRDLYLIKTGMPYSQIINLDRKADLLGFMNRYTFIDLDEIFSLISYSLLCIEQNANVKLLLSNLKLNLRH